MIDKIMGWYTPKGNLKLYPKVIIENILKMMEEQNVLDIKKEIESLESHKGLLDSLNNTTDDGFLWDKTKEGTGFWRQVLTLYNFEMFFNTEDKKTIDPFKNKLYETSKDILIMSSDDPKLIIKGTKWRTLNDTKDVFIYNADCTVSHLILSATSIEIMIKASTYLDSSLLCINM